MIRLSRKDTPQLEGQDVAIGEAINYEITVNIPDGLPIKRRRENKYTSFKLIDSHDPALTFMNQSKGETSYALYDGERLIDTNNYQITEHAKWFYSSNCAHIYPFPDSRWNVAIRLLHVFESTSRSDESVIKTKQMSIMVTRQIKHHRLLRF